MEKRGIDELHKAQDRQGHRVVVDAQVGKAVSSECPRCKEAEKTPEHIVFRCEDIVRLEDSRNE